MSTALLIGGGILLAVLLCYLLKMGKFMAERGIGPDGPTTDRKWALRNGWNGIGKLPWLVLVSYLSILTSFGQAQPSPRARQAAKAQATLAWLADHQAARETWGTNRGPLVDAIIRAGGGNPFEHPEWCGFTQAAANRACGLPIPGGGMQGAARAWFQPGTRLVWFRARNYGSIDSIRIGLKAGFDYGAGIHHIACVAALGRSVRAGRAPRSFYTWAGNEGTGTTAGLHYTLYAITSIDALSNWLY